MLLFWQRRGTCTLFWKYGCRTSGKEQILKRRSKYVGLPPPLAFAHFLHHIFPPCLPVSQPSCLSTICHLQLHQRLEFQNGAFLSAFVSWLKKKKKKITLEKRNMRAGGYARKWGSSRSRRQAVIYTCSTRKFANQICIWSENGVALVHNHYIVYYNYTHFRQRTINYQDAHLASLSIHSQPSWSEP